MANTPLQTITFPGLSDTYTVPGVDSTLAVTGAAADAKATGDEITQLKSNLIDTADGFYPILFNANKNAYINQNNGKLEAYNGWMASDYINCDGESTLYIYAPVASNYGAFYSDKNEESFISKLIVSVGNNAVRVPTSAKYIRLSNTNAGLQGTMLQSKEFSKITDLVNINSVINAGLKDIGSYVFGEYVDNSTGEFVTNTSYKRTGYIPISDYGDKVIYFTSNYRTPYCCFYNASKEKIGIFTIYVGETFVAIPDNAVYCVFSYSRYNALVTMYDPTFTAVKALGFSNIRDINLKNLDRMDILTQMILKPLFLVYTDIHGYPDNLKRIASFYDKNLTNYVKYPICLGDMVRDQATEDIAWMDTDFGKATLKVIGNHDVLASGTLPGITSLEAYNRYIAPNVGNWGVVQPANASTNGYNYYYKDTTYTGGTVRMIVLDEYFYDETQHNWFVATLADANANGYSVIVCQHQSNVWNNQAQYLNDEKAFATPSMGFDLYVTNAGYAGEYASASENRAMAVDAFIGNGGKFICWMSGHTHSDQCHTFEKTHGKQLSLVFSNASMSMTSSNRVDDYSCDCFQYVAVDLAKEYVYVLRIGTAVDKWFHKNEFMCYDYANHEVIEYH